MKRKFSEWLSVHIAKHPGRVLLIGILVFNLAFLFISALVIKSLSLSGTEKMSFFEAAFCTLTMILDPGCIQFVVADIGQMGVTVALTCLAIIFIGMVTFTGAVIGYITNSISKFIETANAGTHQLKTSNHIVILNWNTRASEIINDMLYCDKRQTVVVLVGAHRTEVEKEIDDRLSDTVRKENAALRRRFSERKTLLNGLKRMFCRFRGRVTVVVREGDVFSSKQLHDISLERAKMIVILGNDIGVETCRFEPAAQTDADARGNSHTVKTLMQVADITAAAYSNDNQRIVVEITDEWTGELVNKIIDCKQVDGKCNIIPADINGILGQILSQFSLMPELNYAYRELFSNKGATFFAQESPMEDDRAFIPSYLHIHRCAIPLTHMKNSDGKSYAYYTALSDEAVNKTCTAPAEEITVTLNPEYWIEDKTVIILGHNSRCRDIMEGFRNFRNEWNRSDGEILRIIVIDEEENLAKFDYYREYPFVTETVGASIFDRERICETIERVVNANAEDTSILILSDDRAGNKDIDAGALAHLVYVQDIINKKKRTIPDFDPESIDVIVEIIDPKHYDVVNSYSVHNVVISNRYISKMITQIGEKEALYEFYKDMLTYDADASKEYKSKEIYAKKVKTYFKEIPAPCRCDAFIRAVYNASVSPEMPEELRHPAVALGYVRPGGEIHLFGGDQADATVALGPKDKLIVYSVH